MTEPSPREQLARRIVDRLAAQGYRALYAGGYVRDRLLGMAARSDIDIATNATPTAISEMFSRCIGVGAHFGVLIVVEDGVPFEVATFRSDVGVTDGRHPATVVYTDERMDAQRRDFTVNGMFFDPRTQDLLDYVGGRDDLQRRTIRAIGEPAARFREDYLRLLRAVRFAAQLDFTIEQATFEALRAAAPGIHHISKERVFQELDRMLRGPAPGEALTLLHASGLLREVIPEVAALQGVAQPPEFHPEGDVLRHTMGALRHLSNASAVLAWSALLHDIGKPATMQQLDRIRFNGHDSVGARMAGEVLERLRAPRALIDAVTACIANHMHFAHVAHMRVSTLKRFLSRKTIDDELELHRIDCLASHGMLDNYELLCEKRRELATEELKPAPLLNGHDLLALGFTAGPQLGALLRQAYDSQLEGGLSTREEALAWVKRISPMRDS